MFYCTIGILFSILTQKISSEKGAIFYEYTNIRGVLNDIYDAITAILYFCRIKHGDVASSFIKGCVRDALEWRVKHAKEYYSS